MNSSNKVRVLFVCMGNICRSPAGEGVFQHYVEKQGYTEDIHIDSAGTIAYHTGEPADVRMQDAASKRNYQLKSRARKVITQDIETFDLIIAMDSDNLFDLQSMAVNKEDHICLLGSFLEGYENNPDAPSVPDPYYGGTAGFEQVLDMIEAACPKLLSHCLSILSEK